MTHQDDSEVLATLGEHPRAIEFIQAGPERPPSYLGRGPEVVEIQPTSFCPRVCNFCSHIVRNRANGRLSEANVDELLTALALEPPRNIAFSGGGEPLAWGLPSLAAAVEKAARISAVSLTTSGEPLWDPARQALHSEAAAILSSCKHLLLNVPGTDQELLDAQVSGGLAWNELRKLIEAIGAFRPGFLLWAVVVVNAKNISALTKIDRELGELGFDEVYYKEFKTLEARGYGHLVVSAQDIASSLERQLSAALTASPSLKRFYSSLAREKVNRCPCWSNRLGLTCIVDPRGDLYVCTPTVGDPAHAIGSLHESSFWQIWHGSARAETVERLSSRSASGDCPAECRYHGQNKLIENRIRGNFTPLGYQINAGIHAPRSRPLPGCDTLPESGA